MAEYLSPGVYVEEIDNSPRPLEGVGTSVAGLIGLAEKGPAEGAPVPVTSFADYQKKFGGYLSEFTHEEYRYLPGSVEQFFANGGTRCYVSRVIPGDARKAKVKSGLLSFEAANQGKWGNKIRVEIEGLERRRMQLTAEDNGVYTAKTTEGFREGDIVRAGEEYNRIESIVENKITFEKAFVSEVVDASLLPAVVLYLQELQVVVSCMDQMEKYTGVTFNIASPSFIGTRMEQSAIVKVAALPLEEPKDLLEAVFEEKRGTLCLDDGFDGTIGKVSAGTFIGQDRGPGKRTGIQSFRENTNVSILAVPGITIPEVMVSLAAHCENMKSRFAVLDMPKDAVRPEELEEYRSMIDSTYAAMYHPWIQVFDPSTNRPGFFPPSGAVMGVYSRTDMERGVHKAPANETVACTGLKVNYTKAEQDLLNPEGINLIRALPGQGIRIWGARTASSNSSFRYVNVRRLFIFVEESIKANTKWVVFEPNDATLWSRVFISINSFLEGLWRAGMLVGGSAEEAYFVDIGPDTMTVDDIQNGKLICNVGIAPSRPAEFVIFRVSQNTASSGGGE